MKSWLAPTFQYAINFDSQFFIYSVTTTSYSLIINLKQNKMIQKLTKNEIDQSLEEVRLMITIAIMLIGYTRDSHLKRISANPVIHEVILIASKKSGYSYESIHDFVVDTVRLKNLGMNFGLDVFLQL